MTDPETWQQALDELEGSGLDLSVPHPVDHYISFAHKADAPRAREMAEARGFRVHLERPQRWVLTATHDTTLTAEYLERMRREWELVASSLHDGHYDGWGTQVGPLGPPGWPPGD